MMATKTEEKDETPIMISNLHKGFGNQKVLNGINLRVARGETTAVLGRSGGGKSVLLKLIIRLQTPDTGSIRIAGQEITDLDEEHLNEVRKKVGFLFQQAALYDSLTVEENVAFPLSRHTKMSQTDRKQRVREHLANVGMDRDLRKMPSELSGGMQKRVGLARALVLEPEIVLFFEPTAGLDPISPAVMGSSPAVGSSKSTIWGSKTKARANPTRFCMPPESSEGIFLRSRSIPTLARCSRTRCFLSVGDILVCLFKGNATFSSTVSESYKAACWNRKPTFFLTSFKCSSSRSVISWPAIRIDPLSGVCRRMISFKRTLLPPPLRPRTAVVSPRATRRLIPFKTC